MSTCKSRRAVFAELLLAASPVKMADRRDGVSLSVDFATIAELRGWLEVAGLDTPDLLASTHEGTGEDGRPYRSMHAYPTWHGWEIYASAFEHTGPALLDTQVREALSGVA